MPAEPGAHWAAGEPNKRGLPRRIRPQHPLSCEGSESNCNSRCRTRTHIHVESGLCEINTDWFRTRNGERRSWVDASTKVWFDSTEHQHDCVVVTQDRNSKDRRKMPTWGSFNYQKCAPFLNQLPIKVKQSVEQLQQNDTEQRVLAKIRGLSWIFETASRLAETQKSGEALLRLLQEETTKRQTLQIELVFSW